MGLLSNPLRSREQRLPVYERVRSPTKERYSNDDDYTSDDDESDYSSSGPSYSSRHVSDSIPAGTLAFPKRKPIASRRLGGLYPYRMPTRITRYVFFIVVGTIVLMILSLVRASQVENWKLANGKVNVRPPPPPLWEKFPFLERYYGGIRTLTSFENREPEFPQLVESISSSPAQAEKKQRDIPGSISWEDYPGRAAEQGIQECYIDAGHKIRPPSLRYYQGRPHGFPDHVAGSYDVLKLPQDICFERYGRYGPYGYGYSTRTGGLGTGEHGENEGSEAVWDSSTQVDFREIDWADVQRRCVNTNSALYKTSPKKTSVPHGFYIENVETPATIQRRDTHTNETVEVATAKSSGSNAAPVKSVHHDEQSDKGSDSVKEEASPVKIDKKSRTAVVVRTWDEYIFREDDIANVRSMITELAMASGGRYDIHLLVQVKNDAKYPIWADHAAYEKRVNDVIPEEFRGLVTLWTETQMLALYQGMHDLFSRGPELPVHGVYRGLSMAMQYFAYMHPEYDYFWQWEIDVRYTGHYYDLFAKLEDWSKAQPRKGLWERNSRFYFPTIHGSWDEFSQMSKIRSEMGPIGSETVWKKIPGAEDQAPERVPGNQKTVWGPRRSSDSNDWFETENDPMPPTSYEKDASKWGVGEEADYISLNPIFDPDGTTWLLKDDITGFNRSEAMPPRRANIITTSRMSRRLLMTMHKMTAYKKQFAFPEMWPATVALQHGYKAVFAPHPMYVDRKWPVEYMAQTYNGGHDGSSGASRNSVFGDREHNLHGLSWFYKSGFAPNLYRRWLGMKVNNDGGEEFEMTEDKSKKGGNVGSMPGGEGRMCLPPMLLHPVKSVELPVESPPEEQGEESVESDPAA